ncbi:MAG TPA: glycosyltransferase family 4 protein, partial [Flavitalea sp.]|nr:glycosyltransferase family 4 protein [Flavitalea sp.]
PVVLPNVVDSSKFFPGQHSHSLFRFIHISTLSYQKNPEQIVDALAMLKERTTIPFELVIYGPPRKDIQNYVEQKGLSALIDFRGEVNHDEIALQIRHSAALILFSRFETFGCVVAEALVSGVPVIVSDIAVMKELVTDFKNGILVPADRPDTLAGKMRWMIVNRYRFSSEIISAEAGRKYGISRIAGLFDSFYNKVTRSIT